jgi:hypothetical protein
LWFCRSLPFASGSLLTKQYFKITEPASQLGTTDPVAGQLKIRQQRRATFWADTAADNTLILFLLAGRFSSSTTAAEDSARLAALLTAWLS